MISKYEKTRLSDTFINLTNQTIFLYDIRTGDIRNFLPEQQELPELPQLEISGKPVVHYIISQEQFTKIANSKRPLDDIAFAHHRFHGRNGTIITYLAWGKDPEINVILYSDAHNACFTHQ